MNFTINILYLFLILAGPLMIQGQVMDDFSDGDFTSNPTWLGDVADYEVDAGFTLHLNAASVDNESHLVTVSEAINSATWEVTISMGFNPSSTSTAFVYLSSDQADLEGDLNGYYVMIGNSADEISLYRKDGSDETILIDGTDDVIDASSVNVRIRVTRDDLGNWELFHDVDLTGTFTSEGTALDVTHTSSSYFGVVSKYIASRSTLFNFDDVVVTGTGVIDVTAPELNSVTVVDANTLKLIFNEALDPISAENMGNYTWLPFNSPSSATVLNNTVTLMFSSAFPDNVEQEIQVESVEDLAGNAMGTVTETFFHEVLGTGMAGSVIFNELMADPTPSQGLPETEFIELYNRSDSAFNLLGWNLRNTEADEILESFVLLPGQYVIICDDSFEADFAAYGDVLPVSSLTALTNTGDDLYLFNSAGTLIEEIVYELSWYGPNPEVFEGFSLERRNPNLPCDDPANWGGSANVNGGTPGTQNSIFVADDVTPPLAENLFVADLNTLLISFNEGMDELSLMIGTYELNVSNSIVPETTPNLNEVLLNLDIPLEYGQTYELSISEVFDCSGNEISPVTLSFFIPDIPEAGDVLINEIMADPTPVVDLPDAEYIEILNVSDKSFNLENWVFRNSTTDMLLPAETLLPSEYIILCNASDSSLFSSYGRVIGLPVFTALSNNGDDLYLRGSDGQLIDEIIYNSSWYNDADRDEGGYSLERINPELPCSSSSNWRASVAADGGTPGQENAVLDLSPDELSPLVESALLIQENQIRIAFTEPMEALSIDEGDFVFTPSLDIQSVNITSMNSAVLVLDEVLVEGIVYSLAIGSMTDCSGNELAGINTYSFALPEDARAGDLILNEVLFNPYTGGVDFVEIYNRSPRAISLRNWKMANLESGEMANVELITNQELLILPGEFKLFTEDTENIVMNYPQGQAKNYVEVGDLPSYNDDEGTVILVDPSFEAHDEFYYNKDYHFGLIDDVNGVSLERVDYERLTNDPTNWHSAAEKVGWATPGYENSQLQPANASSQAFSIDPDIFSPDNDGFQDLLNISYTLDKPGSVANVSIFDRDGRLIRLLTRNELLATSGTISWDGLSDDGTKARIGVYIILLELFDLEGNVSSSKKTCVLGGRF